MSRPDGFPIADVDVRLLTDPRVIRAVRQGGPAAVVAYMAVVLASWADGQRVTLEDALEALPRAYGTELDATLEVLVQLELLDPEGRIPADTWASWYEPAASRRDARREFSARGGEATRRRWAQAQEEPEAMPKARPKAMPKARPNPGSDRPTDDATSVASVGLTPDAPANPDGLARRARPPDSGKPWDGPGPKDASELHAWTWEPLTHSWRPRTKEDGPYVPSGPWSLKPRARPDG